MRKIILLLLLMLSLIFSISKSFAQKDSVKREQGWSFAVSINNANFNPTGYLDEIPFSSGPLRPYPQSIFGFDIMLKVPFLEDENITYKRYNDYFFELKRSAFDLYFKLGYQNMNYNFYRTDKELVGTYDGAEEVEIESKFNIYKDFFYFESGLSYNFNFNLEFFAGMRIDYSRNSDLEYSESIINQSYYFDTNERILTMHLTNYLSNNKYNIN